MKPGDKLQVVQDNNGKIMLYFCAGDYLSHKNFSIGDAVEAIKYLLLDEEGRKGGMLKMKKGGMLKMKKGGMLKMNKTVNPPFGNFKRYWFECERGRRWTEADLSGQSSTKDGDICSFSGCIRDHKVKLIKTTINRGVFTAAEEADLWFKGWDKEAF